jgi:hypothetical protein
MGVVNRTFNTKSQQNVSVFLLFGVSDTDKGLYKCTCGVFNNIDICNVVLNIKRDDINIT